VPVESIAPSTSPSINSSLLNLTVPLIETPLESSPPAALETDAPFGWDGVTDGGGGGGSDLRVENIFMREFLQITPRIKLILFCAAD